MEKSMKKIMTVLAMALAVAGSTPALAHESHAKHGGIVKSAGDLSFELVNKDGKTTIYVDDHGKDLPMTGGSGTLTVLKGAEKTQVALTPGGANMLVAKDGVKLEAGNKVVAAIMFPDKSTTSVRFAIK
jgi:hypothetical protein